ncbi:MAG: CmcJ/NvfI family oxidoreductase [Candidatus Binatia bacterium]
MTTTSIIEDTTRELQYIEAPLNYLSGETRTPATYMYTPPVGVPVRSGQYVAHTLPIFNGRVLRDRLSLDQHGFQLVRRETRVQNFYDEHEVKAVYYPEVEYLVRKFTGATRVLAFDHNVRCGTKSRQGEKGVREPVKTVHNDYTLKSGPQRVHDLLPAEEAEVLLQHRFAVVNVWRPIRGPVQESPLAVCDARSIAQEDFVPTDLVYRDRKGEVYSVAFNPSHHWFYFPSMQTTEALLLKCYDSADDGRARFTAHSAFVDPTSPSDAPARESIEARTLAFFAS